MPTADFFEQFGLIAFKNFLDRDLCAELRTEILSASKVGCTVRDMKTGEYIIDDKFAKRSQTNELGSQIGAILEEKLKGLTATISAQFGVRLKGIQAPRYCLYEKGDYFRYHVDSGDHKYVSEEGKPRKVSGIIFLNDESREPEEGKYSGGNLTFYGLNDNEAFAKFGLPLVGEQGMLITFPPTLPHEVTPVTYGERFTIATWFI